MDLFTVEKAREILPLKKEISVSDQLGKVIRRTKKNSTIASWCEEIADKYHELTDDGVHEFRFAAIERRKAEDYLGLMTLLPPDLDGEFETAYRNRGKRLRDCCKYWFLDHYRYIKIKDLRETNLCRDRFCDNCQNALALQRQDKYRPFLEHIADEFDVCHVVFTVPNCDMWDLNTTLDMMFSRFGHLIRYFANRASIRGYDFSRYGYFGALRALEITKNSDTQKFHPHFHCLFIFKKGVNLTAKKCYINQFSFDKEHVKRKHHRGSNDEPRKFTEFEILLQKIWYLLLNGIKVNQKHIFELKQGYSVICDKAKKGEYHEVFKYATKGIFNGSGAAGFYDFVALDSALKGRRVIQGYGALRSIDFESDIDLSICADEFYAKFIAACKVFEDPVPKYENLQQIAVHRSRESVDYISRTAIRQFLGDEHGKESWSAERRESSLDVARVAQRLRTGPRDPI